MVFVGYMLNVHGIHHSYVEDGYISIWNIHFSDVVHVCIGVALIFLWWKHPGRNGRVGFGSGVEQVAQSPTLLRWPVLVLLAYALAWPFGMDHARHARSTLNLFRLNVDFLALVPQLWVTAKNPQKYPEAELFMALLILNRFTRMTIVTLRTFDSGMIGYVWPVILPDIGHTLLGFDFFILWARAQLDTWTNTSVEV